MTTTLHRPPVPALDTRPVRVDAAVRTGAAAAVGAGLALVAYWWVVGGGVGDLTGWASGLTSLAASPACWRRTCCWCRCC